jgi:hypothetical protein
VIVIVVVEVVVEAGDLLMALKRDKVQDGWL